jgi:hypothetical protein
MHKLPSHHLPSYSKHQHNHAQTVHKAKPYIGMGAYPVFLVAAGRDGPRRRAAGDEDACRRAEPVAPGRDCRRRDLRVKSAGEEGDGAGERSAGEEDGRGGGLPGRTTAGEGHGRRSTSAAGWNPSLAMDERTEGRGRANRVGGEWGTFRSGGLGGVDGSPLDRPAVAFLVNYSERYV